MNYKDVRIGNLVKYKGKIYRIAGISDTYPFLDTIEFGAGGIDWHELEGVELNERLLVDFGFDIKTNESYSSGKRVLFNVYMKRDFTYNSIQGCWWYYGRLMKSKMNFAHQLQNAFYALENKELEYHPTPE
jgi:hypothetical protein